MTKNTTLRCRCGEVRGVVTDVSPNTVIYGKYAVGGAQAGSRGPNLRLFIRAVRKVLAWRIRGRAWPHPFFQRETRLPDYPLTTLSEKEREALRLSCGPHPSP